MYLKYAAVLLMRFEEPVKSLYFQIMQVHLTIAERSAFFTALLPTSHESLKRHCEEQKRLNPDRMCEQCCLSMFTYPGFNRC